MKRGMFVSVWNDGEYTFTTSCEYDVENNIIQNVGQIEDLPNNLQSLDEEYVEDFEGNTFPVCMECHEKFLKIKNVNGEETNFCDNCPEE